MASYDYPYDLTDEQLLRYSALPAIAKLRWLDQARRFTLLGRTARAKAWKVEDPGVQKDGR
ncbi:MAG: hypothetical protein WD775_09880 [Burkholderiales bacterium]